jgi:flagellar biosynthesis regulator FlaF
MEVVYVSMIDMIHAAIQDAREIGREIEYIEVTYDEWMEIVDDLGPFGDIFNKMYLDGKTVWLLGVRMKIMAPPIEEYFIIGIDFAA